MILQTSTVHLRASDTAELRTHFRAWPFTDGEGTVDVDPEP